MSGDSFPIGTTSVLYTYDLNGQTISLVLPVVVSGVTEDLVPPFISNVPSNITAITEAGRDIVYVTWIEPTATDDSGTVMLVEQTAAPGDLFGLGTTEVTYTYEDGAGNRASVSFSVTVIVPDFGVLRVYNIPTPVGELQGGATSVSLTWSAPIVLASGRILDPTSQSHRTSDIFMAGITIITYEYNIDGSIYTLSFIALVRDPNDVTPPEIMDCPDNIAIQIAEGTNSVIVVWDEVTAADNGVPILPVQSHRSEDAFVLGTTMATYTFTDSAGNSAICSFDVNITRTVNPCDSNPCPSDATCFFNPVTLDSFICVIQSQRMKRDTQVNIETETCPCENGGQCFIIDLNQFICKCPPNTDGSLCENTNATSTVILADTFNDNNSYGIYQWSMLTTVGVLFFVICVLAITICNLSRSQSTSKHRSDEVAIIN